MTTTTDDASEDMEGRVSTSTASRPSAASKSKPMNDADRTSLAAPPRKPSHKWIKKHTKRNSSHKKRLKEQQDMGQSGPNNLSVTAGVDSAKHSSEFAPAPQQNHDEKKVAARTITSSALPSDRSKNNVATLGIQNLPVVPEEFTEYTPAAIVPRQYDEKLAARVPMSSRHHDENLASGTTITRRSKNYRSLDEVSGEDVDKVEEEKEEEEEVCPGVVFIRGTSYRSGDTTEPYEEYNNERSQASIEPRVSANIESFVLSDGSLLSAYEVEDSTVVQEARIINVKKQRVMSILLVTVMIIVTIGVVVPITLITNKGNSGTEDVKFVTMIENLCSPRHLTVHDNKLFVPEAGVGAMQFTSDPVTGTLCVPSSQSAVTGDICLGNTGQVKAVNLDGTDTGQIALSGLFSARQFVGASTNQVYGASSVSFDDYGNMFTLLGLGLVNASYVAIQDPELVFASVLQGDKPVASPWVKVYQQNYAQAPFPESNPFHMFMHDGTTYVVDAGADLLFTYLNVENAGKAEPDSVVVLPKIENITAVKPNPRGGTCVDVDPPPDGPAYCGQYQDNEGNWLYTANPVPTAVRVNPKEPNRLYVAYLGGSFWNEPMSGIWYMDLIGGIPQMDTIKSIQGDFWAVIDFDFYGDYIFVLETNPGGAVPFDGRLSKVTVDLDGSVTSKVIITEDLYEPVGLIIHEDTIFVANNTFNTDFEHCNGQILRGQLR